MDQKHFALVLGLFNFSEIQKKKKMFLHFLSIYLNIARNYEGAVYRENYYSFF